MQTANTNYAVLDNVNGEKKAPQISNLVANFYDIVAGWSLWREEKGKKSPLWLQTKITT